ncbi:MAG TPA: hypothetical protein VMP67_03505 [Candidatus Limnocylindria bacterium]|nr:hypothetical protein [Candidatus Limnocylindria bacterium]
MESRVTSTTEQGLRLEHKHGLDEWSPMMPERSAQSVVIGEEPEDEMYRCQRIGCTEVVKLGRDERIAQ